MTAADITYEIRTFASHRLMRNWIARRGDTIEIMTTAKECEGRHVVIYRDKNNA
jgi:hypothetical protein